MMMQDILSEADWLRLIPDPPLQQSWAYGATMQALGGRVRRVRADGGAVQVLERRGLRLISRPQCGAAVWRRMARHAGLTLVTTPGPARGIVPLITARHHAEWHIAAEPDALLAAMDAKWRNHLRGSKSADISEGHTAILAQICELCAAQAHVRGYRDLPGQFVESWTGDRLILHLSRGGLMLAGAVFLIHGAIATYQLAWTDPEGRRAEAHRAMLWRAALMLRQRGVRRIDLGALDADNPGLARFKLGTGARLVEVGPTSLVLPG